MVETDIMRFSRHHLNPLPLGIALTLLLSLGAADLGKYQLILDKELFGADPPPRPPPRPTPIPPVRTPSWSKPFRMTMITFDDYSGSVRVGLQNNKTKQSVLLIEGENTHRDYKLLEADFKRGTARVSYRGTPHEFQLSQGPPPTSSSPRRSSRPDRSRSSRPRRPTPRSSTGRTNTTAAPTPRPTPRFRTREELQAHLKEVQMDAIRTGKPPLPIPLTKEMDEQLVKEGALPPQE